MSNIKQLIIGPLPPPIGGVSVSVVNLMKVLDQANIEYATYSTSRNQQMENLYGQRRPSQYFFSLQVFLGLIIYLFKNHNVRICHLFVVSNGAFFRDALLLVSLKLFRKKIIIHLHSKTEGELFLGKQLVKLLGRVLGIADLVFVLSDSHKAFFSKYIHTRINVLENYVFRECANSCKPKTTHWLYVGRLSKMKGFWDLLEALSICVNKLGTKSIVVDCLGLAESDCELEKIKAYISKQGLSGIVLLHGMVVGEEKQQYFDRSKGFIFPSRFENSPVVLKEATSAGLPVLCSNIDANKNILDRVGNAIYFDSSSPIELSKIFHRVEQDDFQLSKLAENARKSYKYDGNYAESILTRAFDELIDNSNN